MDTHLPNAKEIRLKLRIAGKRKVREGKERRMYARWLLFCKGSGMTKNLPMKEIKFISEVKKESYFQLVSDLNMEKRGQRYEYGYQRKPLKYTRWGPGNVPSYQTYIRIWYGGAKANYIRHDIPKIMKLKMEALRDANGNTQMQKRGGRYMQELIRQIGERERGVVDLQVRQLPMPASREQRQREGQKQLRGGRKKTPAGNRDAAEVGKA